jgi:molecular chaperone GrpE
MSRKTKQAAEEKKAMDASNEKAINENLTQAEQASAESEKMAAPGAGNDEINSETAVNETEKNQKAGPTAEEQIAQLQDKYLRLSADFDNYRKRTLREKADLIKTAGEEILSSILPVVDDFDRAMKLLENAQDLEAFRQGIVLIHGKFKEFLIQKGIKEIEALNQPFNVDLHEAITKIPAPEEELKGKNVDVISKGYMLYDKVIRYSKVVVGE